MVLGYAKYKKYLPEVYMSNILSSDYAYKNEVYLIQFINFLIDVEYC
jgi:hypothetical protein